VQNEQGGRDGRLRLAFCKLGLGQVVLALSHRLSAAVNWVYLNAQTGHLLVLLAASILSFIEGPLIIILTIYARLLLFNGKLLAICFARAVFLRLADVAFISASRGCNPSPKRL